MQLLNVIHVVAFVTSKTIATDLSNDIEAAVRAEAMNIVDVAVSQCLVSY